MRELFSEPRIRPTLQNVAVAINLSLFLEKNQGAAGFGKAGNLDPTRIVRIQRQDGQTSARGQRNAGGKFQRAVGLDTDFDGLHDRRLAWRNPIAKQQP
jgi:hypothetical protein